MCYFTQTQSYHEVTFAIVEDEVFSVPVEAWYVKHQQSGHEIYS